MTEAQGNALTTAEQAAQRMRAVAAALAAQGLSTRMYETRAGLDLTAVYHAADQRETELVLDEDGYAELRYWNPPEATPAEIAATALRAFAAVRPDQPKPASGGE